MLFHLPSLGHTFENPRIHLESLYSFLLVQWTSQYHDVPVPKQKTPVPDYRTLTFSHTGS